MYTAPAMQLELVVVRHGQSEGNRDHVFTGHGLSRLTPRGRREAEATARRIIKERVTAIFSSDLPRTLETAAPLVSLTGLPVQATKALRERDIGGLTGMSFADIQTKMPDVWQALMSRDPSFRPPGGESGQETRARMGEFVDGLFQQFPEGRIVIVSHGIAITQLLYHLLGFPKNETPHVVFQVENCSLQRIIRRADGTTRIAGLNDFSHLAEITDDDERNEPR